MATTSRSADLTSGPMLQKIILFSVPLAASSILQLLFNAADVVVVGRFAGSTALAAVGSNGSLINLLVNLFVGLSLGANVVAARCFGARDEKGVQDTVHTAVALGLVSGVLLAVVGFCAARGLLELMSCPEDVISLSTLYLKIYFIGMPMTMLYNFSSALLRAVGDCWVSVKQFSKNDTATACQDWLRSTRLGRGSIKSHVRTVKVLGMGLFAFQERIHLWKGVTH